MEPKRIAMWSGPRNLSTAMMYAFAARGDCAVWDEPFYSAYLSKTGLDHPMRQAVIDGGEPDPAKVAQACLGPAPDGQPVFYQKHMCQHMIDGVPRDWMGQVTNVFLIRHPARVVASFSAKHEAIGLADIGFLQQAELFDQVAEMTGDTPLVIDSNDIRANPSAMMAALCEKLGLDKADQMLSWPEGPKLYDGTWASHWYGAVWKSTGFAGQEGPLPELDGEYAAISEAALPFYERLKPFALKPE